MFRLDERLKVYLHRAPVDFRLNINGLALTVEQLHWLLEGIDVGVVHRHPQRVYQHVS